MYLLQGVAGEENSLTIVLVDALGLDWRGTAEGFMATISTVPPSYQTLGEVLGFLSLVLRLSTLRLDCSPYQRDFK